MTSVSIRQAILPTTVGMREFTRNIATLKRRVKKSPMLVLSNNQPDFVAVDMDMYQKMVAAMEEVHYAELFEKTVAERKGNKKISWAAAKKQLGLA